MGGERTREKSYEQSRHGFRVFYNGTWAWAMEYGICDRYSTKKKPWSAEVVRPYWIEHLEHDA